MRSEKTYLVNQIASGLTDSDYVYFVSFQGLKVKDFSGLRDQLFKVNANVFCLFFLLFSFFSAYPALFPVFLNNMADFFPGLSRATANQIFSTLRCK